MPSKPAEDGSKKTSRRDSGRGFSHDGKLYVVATPVGNLADVTLRALETLRSVDLIAAEDTRHTRKLLSHYDIHKPLASYHSNNAKQRGAELLAKIAQGRNIALVTDAGTPGISDPGALLVAEALGRGVQVIEIPGPTALISALVISGLQPHPFAFLGFPPTRGSARRRFFSDARELPMTLVLYESPKKLNRTLEEILAGWGDRRVAVARELTKIHEEVFRGSVSEALAHFAREVKGEITLVVEGRGPEPGAMPQTAIWEKELAALIEGGESAREAASAVAAKFGVQRRIVYQAAVRMKGG